MSYVGVLFTFLFAQNVMLYYLLGIESVEELQQNRFKLLFQEGLVLMGVCSISAVLLRTVYLLILVPLGISYLKTFTAVLIILWIGKVTDSIVHQLGVSINGSRLTVNTLVFGISLLAIHSRYSWGESFVAGLAGGLGYLMAVYLLEVLREQFQREWIPRAFQGIPILLVSAGLIAMAFHAIDVALLKRVFG